jgi:tRNA(adenine34) deaminase
MTSSTDAYWMERALGFARQSAENGEVPVGAVLISGDKLLAGTGNSPINNNDPTAHAEILALRSGAEKLQNYRLPETTLYVTLEPCIMCMGAIIHSRVKRLVFGATDPKTGAAHSVYQIGQDGILNHKLVVSGGILEDECSKMLKEFFKSRRRK